MNDLLDFVDDIELQNLSVRIVRSTLENFRVKLDIVSKLGLGATITPRSLVLH
jgi:hypothetical protein